MSFCEIFTPKQNLLFWNVKNMRSPPPQMRNSESACWPFHPPLHTSRKLWTSPYPDCSFLRPLTNSSDWLSQTSTRDKLQSDRVLELSGCAVRGNNTTEPPDTLLQKGKTSKMGLLFLTVTPPQPNTYILARTPPISPSQLNHISVCGLPFLLNSIVLFLSLFFLVVLLCLLSF